MAWITLVRNFRDQPSKLWKKKKFSDIIKKNYTSITFLLGATLIQPQTFRIAKFMIHFWPLDIRFNRIEIWDYPDPFQVGQIVF